MLDDDEPQTAMLLTEQEWNDLEVMVTAYRESTYWTRYLPPDVDEPAVKIIRRRLALADRIIDANS